MYSPSPGGCVFYHSLQSFSLYCKRRHGKSVTEFASLGESQRRGFFFVLLKSCNRAHKLPLLHCALPHCSYGAVTLLCLSLLFSLRSLLLFRVKLVSLSALLSLFQLSFASPILIPPLCFSAVLRNSSKPEFVRKPREERLPWAMHFQA